MKICEVEGCDGPAKSAKWCGKHYMRWKRNGDPLKHRTAPMKNRICSVGECSQRAKARGLCPKHFGRWQAHGSTEKPVPRPSIVGQSCSTVGCPGVVTKKSARHMCSKCYRAQVKAEGRLSPIDPVYSVWSAMRERCNRPSHPSYGNYGGRGITISERWDSFAAFKSDMGPRPDGMSIERKDNDGPYSPENCKWATRREQQNNRRNNYKVVYDGTELTISSLARMADIKQATLYGRIVRKGWDVERAVTEPVKGRGNARSIC